MEETKKQEEDKNSHKSFVENIQPLRTLKGDIAQLISGNHLSEDDLKKLGKNLKEEALAYKDAGGDDAFFKNLKIGSETSGTPQKENKQTIENQVNQFITKKEEDIVSKHSVKSREKTKELKKEYETSVNVQDKYKEALEKITKKIEPSKIEPKKEEPEIENKVPKHEIKEEKESGATKIHTPTVLHKPPEKPVPPPPSPPPKVHVQTEEEKLLQEEREIKTQINTLPQKIRAILENLDKLQNQKERLENFITPLVVKEREIEEQEQIIVEQEQKEENKELERKLEEKRWVLEDRRKDLEQKRWRADQTIIKIVDETKKLDKEKTRFTDEQTYLEQKLVNIERKKRAQTAENDLKILKQKLDVYENKKEPIELKWIALSENRKRILQEVSSLQQNEKIVDEQISETEIQEKSTNEAEEQHKYESERWQLEEKRRGIERKRWELEDKNEKIDLPLKELKEEYQKILKEEGVVEEKIVELENIISESKEVV